MEARILEKRHIAVAHFADDFRGRWTDAVGRERHRSAESALKTFYERPQRIFPVGAAFRPAEMRKNNNFTALFGELANRRKRAIEPRRIAETAILHRKIEIEPQKHAPAGKLRIVERSERFSHELGQIVRPTATAVSAIRLEKPHSLSYHDRIRTNVPSITLVWSMWNTEEWGS